MKNILIIRTFDEKYISDLIIKYKLDNKIIISQIARITHWKIKKQL